MRLVAASGPGSVRPGQMLQQRLTTPIRGTTVHQNRVVTTIRQPGATQPVIVSGSQPPALHPVVYPTQVRQTLNVVRQPIVRSNLPGGQVRYIYRLYETQYFRERFSFVT